MALSRLDRRDAAALAAQVANDRALASSLMERIVRHDFVYRAEP
jgi:hypothetical protein